MMRLKFTLAILFAMTGSKYAQSQADAEKKPAQLTSSILTDTNSPKSANHEKN
jgi:hypothetical protein